MQQPTTYNFPNTHCAGLSVDMQRTASNTLQAFPAEKAQESENNKEDEEDEHEGEDLDEDVDTISGHEDTTLLELSVLTISGHCYTVVAVGSWSVKEVKENISNETMLAPHQQRLMLGTRVLSDTDVLAELLPTDQTHHELLLVICTDEVKADIITDLVTGRTRLSSVDSKYHEDSDVVSAAVRYDGMQLQYAHGAPRKDRSIVLSAIASNGFALSFAPKGFNAEREVVLMAVKSNAFSITLAAESLQNDHIFVEEAIRANIFVRDHLDIGEKSKRTDPKIVSKLATAPPAAQKHRKSFCPARFGLSRLARHFTRTSEQVEEAASLKV